MVASLTYPFPEPELTGGLTMREGDIVLAQRRWAQLMNDRHLTVRSLHRTMKFRAANPNTTERDGRPAIRENIVRIDRAIRLERQKLTKLGAEPFSASRGSDKTARAA